MTLLVYVLTEAASNCSVVSVYLICEELTLVDPRIDLAGSKVLTADSTVD
jgi:hypothetical protein